MLDIIHLFIRAIQCFFRSRAAMQLEILALRHQILVLRRKKRKRLRLNGVDRFLWVFLLKSWSQWRDFLVIVKPETVVQWHQAGFKSYWRWKSCHLDKSGRKPISKEVRDLIGRMSKENPLWGAPRIHWELLKLGYHLVQSSVAKYMIKIEKPPSQTWKTFLENHMDCTVAMDFFTVPTIFFKVLHVLVLLDHERRFIVHFNVTTNPTAGGVYNKSEKPFRGNQYPGFWSMIVTRFSWPTSRHSKRWGSKLSYRHPVAPGKIHMRKD